MPDDASIMLTLGNVGALPLSEKIFSVVGQAPTLLTRPPGAKYLVIASDRGSFRMRKGDFVASGMPDVEFPVATDTVNGASGLYFRDGSSVVIQLDDSPLITVRGYTPTAILTYFWR